MCKARALPTVWPKPGSTLNTPSGMPASVASAARRMAVSGDFSEGLRITEFPVASAGAIFQAAMIMGKFQGTMAATTPIGSREIMPIWLWGVGASSPYTLSMASAVQRMARAVAGTSTVRAWLMGLPISRVSSRASSSPWASIKSAKRISTALRLAGASSRQSPRSKTFRAMATALSASALSQLATWASSRPFTGLIDGKVSPFTAQR